MGCGDVLEGLCLCIIIFQLWPVVQSGAIVDGHVIDDIACLVDACGVILGSWWITGAQRSSRGELGCLGGVLDRCWGLKGC